MINISIFSFFSGSGLLDLGFETSGFNISFVNEYHQPFLNAYLSSRRNMKIEEPEFGYSSESITELLNPRYSRFINQSLKAIKSKDCLTGFIGGPPCPDFSIGGKNRGRHGDNGKLSGTYIEMINKHKPDFFLFENVKGLWRTTKHREFFNELKKNLHLHGYATSERLINSIEYGVPQDRERIILFGVRKAAFGLSRKLIDIEDFPWSYGVEYKRNHIFSLDWPTVNEFKEDSALPMPKDIPVKLTVEHWFRNNCVSTHQNADHCFKPKAGLIRFRQIYEGDDSKKSFKRIHRWRYSPTACYGNNEVHLHPYKARRINVAEALSIQSMPKEFVLPDDMSLTDMFKTIGNGVPFLAARGIALTIKKYLNDLCGGNNESDGI